MEITALAYRGWPAHELCTELKQVIHSITFVFIHSLQPDFKDKMRDNKDTEAQASYSTSGFKDTMSKITLIYILCYSSSHVGLITYLGLKTKQTVVLSSVLLTSHPEFASLTPERDNTHGAGRLHAACLVFFALTVLHGRGRRVGPMDQTGRWERLKAGCCFGFFFPCLSEGLLFAGATISYYSKRTLLNPEFGLPQ